MSKGNPIVGLAHVVVSQQEMLEKANEQIEELQNRIKSKQDDADNLDNYLKESNRQIMKLKEELQNEKDRNDSLSGECDRIKKQVLELEEKLQKERSNPFHWQKWEEGKEFPLDKFGNVPMVDGLYLFNNDSNRAVWIEKETRCAPLAGKYGIDCVVTNISHELKDRGVFTISPSNTCLSDATLVAVSIRSIAEVTLLDSMPELIDEES